MANFSFIHTGSPGPQTFVGGTGTLSTEPSPFSMTKMVLPVTNLMFESGANAGLISYETINNVAVGPHYGMFTLKAHFYAEVDTGNATKSAGIALWNSFTEGWFVEHTTSGDFGWSRITTGPSTGISGTPIVSGVPGTDPPAAAGAPQGVYFKLYLNTHPTKIFTTAEGHSLYPSTSRAYYSIDDEATYPILSGSFGNGLSFNDWVSGSTIGLANFGVFARTKSTGGTGTHTAWFASYSIDFEDGLLTDPQRTRLLVAPGTGGSIYTYDGLEWSSSFGPSGPTLRGVHGPNAGRIWVVGDASTVKLSTDQAQTWVDDPSPPSPSTALHSVWAADSFNTWAVGDSGRIFYHNGNTWTLQFTEPNGITFHHIFGRSTTEIRAIGDDGGGSPTARIYVYNGSSWTEETSFSGTGIRVWGATASDWWAIQGGATIWRWNGVTWATDLVTGNNILGISGVDENDVWATGGMDGGLLTKFQRRTTSWLSSVYPNFFVNSDPTQLIMFSTNEGFAVGGLAPTEQTAFQYNGTTWFQMTPPTQAGTEMLDLFGFDELLSVDSVTGGPVGQQGGFPLTVQVTGVPSNEDLQVFIGPNGDTTDELAYGGQGFGYLPQSSNGSTISIISPQVSFKGSVAVTVRVVSSGLSASLPNALIVMERNWQPKQFEMRQSFPPWYGIGARRLESEEER